METATVAGVGEVEAPSSFCPPAYQIQEGGGQIPGPSGTTLLVIHNPKGVTLLHQRFLDQPHKPFLPLPEQPAGSHHHPIAAHLPDCRLPRQLADPIQVDGSGLVGGKVRGLLLAIEDVVGAEMDHSSPHLPGRQRHISSAVPIHLKRPLSLRLGPIHVGEGGTVEDHIGAGIIDKAQDGLRIGDVEVIPGEGDCLDPPDLGLFGQS